MRRAIYRVTKVRWPKDYELCYRVIHDNANSSLCYCPTRSAAERVAAALNLKAAIEKPPVK